MSNQSEVTRRHQTVCREDIGNLSTYMLNFVEVLFMGVSHIDADRSLLVHGSLILLPSVRSIQHRVCVNYDL